MKKLLTVLLFITTVHLSAQMRHPIDRLAYDAMQEAVTTVDRMEAQHLALNGWEQLLTAVQEALKGVMDSTSYAALDSAQARWLQYRNAEFDFINRVYYAELQGTMWRPVAIGARKKIIRERVQGLMDIYLELNAQEEEVREAVLGTWQSNGAAYEPDLEIRDDLTLQWLEGDKLIELGFYHIGNSCQGEKDERERKAMTIYQFGTEKEAQCYFFSMDDDDKLDLYGVNINRSRSYSRK